MGVLAIIPARGGSKRLPRKNILPFGGKPLIQYTIEAAMNCSLIDRTIVSTDDVEIAEIANSIGGNNRLAPFIRPAKLAKDDTSSLDVIKHSVTFCEQIFGEIHQNIVLLQPTSPLRNAEDLTSAIELYFENRNIPLVSVTLVNKAKETLKVLKNSKLENIKVTDEIYLLNGAIYITNRAFLIEENMIYKDSMTPFIMSKNKSIDIDEESDFILAERVLKKQNEESY